MPVWILYLIAFVCGVGLKTAVDKCRRPKPGDTKAVPVSKVMLWEDSCQHEPVTMVVYEYTDNGYRWFKKLRMSPQTADKLCRDLYTHLDPYRLPRMRDYNRFIARPETVSCPSCRAAVVDYYKRSIKSGK